MRWRDQRLIHPMLYATVRWRDHFFLLSSLSFALDVLHRQPPGRLLAGADGAPVGIVVRVIPDPQVRGPVDRHLVAVEDVALLVGADVRAAVVVVRRRRRFDQPYI